MSSPLYLFDELPQALVRRKIAMGLSQKDLADRLGMKEQQLQRYEATDYQSASMARLREIVDALGVSVREEVFLPTKPASASALLIVLRTPVSIVNSYCDGSCHRQSPSACLLRNLPDSQTLKSRVLRQLWDGYSDGESKSCLVHHRCGFKPKP